AALRVATPGPVAPPLLLGPAAVPGPRPAHRGLGPADGLGDLIDPHAQLTGDEALVAGPDRRVSDGSDDGGGGAHRAHAALDRREVEARDRLRDRELKEGPARLDEVADGSLALLLAQVRGIAPGRLHRDEGLRDEALLQLERLEGGLLPGLVAVEGEDDLAGAGRLIPQQSADDLRVILAERGAARRDRLAHPGQVGGHDVRVPLDDDDPLRSRDLPLREVETVEHLRLPVERRLRGVEVLGALIVLVELPGAEADRSARDVADRPHDAAPEPVVDAAPALRDEARGRDLLRREAA